MSETTIEAREPCEATILAWARLVRAGQAVLAEVEADLKTAGLPPLAWYDVLLELKRAGGELRPVEIEGRLLIAQHNVSRLIDRLSKAGLAERRACPEDARGQFVALTAAGRGLLARMWPIYRAAIQRHVGDKLDEGEAAMLSTLLGKLGREG
jgi:DNA-binding MarR family transcriptional regulator